MMDTQIETFLTAVDGAPYRHLRDREYYCLNEFYFYDCLSRFCLRRLRWWFSQSGGVVQKSGYLE